jgi:hypothetical protein
MNNICQTSGNNTCGGGGSPCAKCSTGQTCDGTSCVCNSSSCTGGCCGPTGCLRYGQQNNDACGVSGTCAKCPAGTRCNTSNGQCECNATTCPTGCCEGNVCRPYASQNTTLCGKGGESCHGCDNAQRCTSGECRCDTALCTGGCCDPTTQACRTTGSGTAVCGRGTTCSTCGAGLTCNGASCICTAASCGDRGCCHNNDVCLPFEQQDINTCGINGSCGACVPDWQVCTTEGCYAYTTCGGIAGGVCASTEFCDGPEYVKCGLSAIGYCQPKPRSCPTDCPGVRGCDGRMYCNACLAHQAGVGVDRQ